MHDQTSALIDEIIALRKAKGLSQRQLSALTGVHQVVIARLETRKNLPNIETLIKLLEAMDARMTIQEISPDQ